VLATTNDMARALITKEALLAEINQEMALFYACRNLKVTDVVFDPARAQGGNWTLVGLRPCNYDHPQYECRKAMADYIANLQDRFDVGFDIMTEQTAPTGDCHSTSHHCR
jgi:hypothetical protein